jgi:hypothetical protein
MAPALPALVEPVAAIALAAAAVALAEAEPPARLARRTQAAMAAKISAAAVVAPGRLPPASPVRPAQMAAAAAAVMVLGAVELRVVAAVTAEKVSSGTPRTAQGVGVPGAAVGTAIIAAGLVALVVPMAAGVAAEAAPITFLAA